MRRCAYDLSDHAAGRDRLACIADELDLSASQLPHWNEFAAAVRRAERERSIMRSISDGEAADHLPSLPQSLHSAAQRLTVDLAALRRIEAAALVLYRSLDPRQRGRADRLLRPISIGRNRSACNDAPLGVLASEGTSSRGRTASH